MLGLVCVCKLVVAMCHENFVTRKPKQKLTCALCVIPQSRAYFLYECIQKVLCKSRVSNHEARVGLNDQQMRKVPLSSRRLHTIEEEKPYILNYSSGNTGEVLQIRPHPG